MCIMCALLKVVSYYDFSVLPISVMGFWIFFNFAKPLTLVVMAPGST